MGIYSYSHDLFRKRNMFDRDDSVFNEAEISDDDDNKDDDDEDYTAGAEDAADDDSNDDTDTGDDEGGGDDEDYTAGAEEAGDDDSGDEDEDTGDEGGSDDDGEDYTAGAEDAADDDSGDEGGDDDTSDEGGDEGDDYTAGAEDAGSDGDLGGDDEGGEGGDEGEGEGDDEGEGDEEEGEDSTFEDLQKIESELFSNLSPEQVEIKNKELKQRFIDVYGTIASVLIRINDIPKTDLNIDVLHFVTDKLMELRDLVDYNITKAFATKTYIENSINYQLCLSTLSSISDIIDSVAGAEDDEAHKAGLDNEDDDGVIVGGTSTEVDTDLSTELGDRMIESKRFSYLDNVTLV